jgi:hypothetical protein
MQSIEEEDNEKVFIDIVTLHDSLRALDARWRLI